MGILRKAVTDRLAGDRPSPVRAIVAAAIVGGGAAAITYKALRA